MDCSHMKWIVHKEHLVLTVSRSVHQQRDMIKACL